MKPSTPPFIFFVFYNGLTETCALLAWNLEFFQIVCTYEDERYYISTFHPIFFREPTQMERIKMDESRPNINDSLLHTGPIIYKQF